MSKKFSWGTHTPPLGWAVRSTALPASYFNNVQSVMRVLPMIKQSAVGVDHYIPRNKFTGEGGFMHYQKALPPHAERVQPTTIVERPETLQQQHDTSGSQEA